MKPYAYSRAAVSLEHGSLNAKTLKAWRKDQYLTQNELAAMLGITLHTVANWERGRRGLPGYLPLALEAISRARETQVRKMRKAQEALAHKRRLRMIEQGLLDEANKKLKPGEKPPKRPTRGNPQWIALKEARLAREAAEAAS